MILSIVSLIIISKGYCQGSSALEQKERKEA